MPAAMHLCALLVSLFAVTVCTDTNTSSEAQTVTELTTSAAPLISFTETMKNDVTSSTEKPTDNTPQHQTTTHQITSAVTSEKTSPSPPASTSPQTPNRTEETYQSHPPETTASNKTSNETVPHVSTTPPSTNATATTTVNTTSPALSHDWEKDDMVKNPGLVAIICIFCIVLVLVLVVAIVKCARSPRSNFERLEDVPLGKVNEESPFAQYSK